MALVLEGVDRQTAARSCGMDRQTLRDWVHRYNDEGVSGLKDRVTAGPRRQLSAGNLAELAALVEKGPDPATDGVVRWRRVDLKRVIEERFGVVLHERTVGKQLQALGFVKMTVRPQHPKSDSQVQDTFKKLRRHDRGRSARARPWQARRDLVPGRSQSWPARHSDPDLGTAWNPAARPEGPPLHMGLHLRRRLPGARRDGGPRSAARQRRHALAASG